jgi:hypothetical protein
MIYEIREAVIFVLGYIWQPLDYLCTGVYKLTPKKVEELKDETGSITRESVKAWVSNILNIGDFQRIVDFRASIYELEIPWELEDSETIFEQQLTETKESL